MTAGERLRAQLDQALARTGKERNVTLTWDERELAHLEAAQAAADSAERIAARLDDPGIDSNALTKLSAERRLQLKAVGDHVDRLGMWAQVPKSEQHQRAGKARWDQFHAKVLREAR